jgi:large subunit ribosomal protein L25
MTVFNVQKRVQMGSKNAKALRKNGFIPATVYGLNRASDSVELSLKDLVTDLKKPGFLTRVFTFTSPTDTQKVIARQVQYHPLTDLPIHVEFQRLDDTSRVKLNIPVRYINEDKSPGIKLGGVLNVIVHSLEVTCTPTSIPHEFIVDLTGTEANKSIHLDALSFPEGVVAVDPLKDHTLASIVNKLDTEETQA